MKQKVLSLSMLLLLSGAVNKAFAAPEAQGVNIVQQNGKCSGVVIDATGEPIIGASVLVKGTTTGTITDFDGNFTLDGVSRGATLVISYVGYKGKEVKWDGQALTVVLEEDTALLEEVVVTGYGGSQKRATMTTAISKMDNKVLETAAFSNAGQALQGT